MITMEDHPRAKFPFITFAHPSAILDRQCASNVFFSFGSTARKGIITLNARKEIRGPGQVTYPLMLDGSFVRVEADMIMTKQFPICLVNTWVGLFKMGQIRKKGEALLIWKMPPGQPRNNMHFV